MVLSALTTAAPAVIVGDVNFNRSIHTWFFDMLGVSTLDHTINGFHIKPFHWYILCMYMYVWIMMLWWVYSNLVICICFVSASLLLDNLISYLTTSMLTTKAVYLHVLTTNQIAIRFYERRNFRMHHFLPYYYAIEGSSRDGYCYVLYINGGEPPWTILYPFRKQ